MHVPKRLLLLLLSLLLSGCGQSPEPVSSVEEPTDPFHYVFEERAYLLPDGEPRGAALGESYENEALRLHWTYPAPQTGSLTAPATKAMCAWFQKQGLLCDTEALVNTALADYADAQDSGRTFQPYHVTQDTHLTCQSVGLWGFSTTVSTPANFPRDQYMEESIYQSDFFDAAGEYLELWDLFTVPEATVRRRLLDLCQKAAPPEDSTSLAELEQWFQPSSVVFWPEHVEVVYGPDTLEKNQRIYAFAYGGLADILQSWALPDAWEELEAIDR